MRVFICSVMAAFVSASVVSGQVPARALVAIWAHADDEGPVGPLLARYAREGVKVYMIIATDGSQGAANASVPRGPEIARLREDEARCSAQALGAEPPILLGFPDGALGDSRADPSLLYRLTQRLQEELQRLQPQVLITWGPDGGYGHPDHRIVNSIVTQLVRAGAPGVPQRVFYSTIPADGIRAMNPARGAPPFLIPDARLFTAHVAFTAADFESGRRSMMCQKTQFSDEAVARTAQAMKEAWNGEISVSPMVPRAATSDLFR